MSFDYKKEYKEFYKPKLKPSIVEIPKMNYLAIRGKGDPNQEGGDYQKCIGLLYAVAYTIKMSHKGDYKIEGFFEYVVPPLEGFWWQDNVKGMDYDRKSELNFISLIRLPEFVSEKDFGWAIEEASRKKKEDFSRVEFFTYNEGLCVQAMHIGSYDDEPNTIEAMHEFMVENGYELDINEDRYHHEIYLSDPRKSDPSKLKTVIRHPIKKAMNQVVNDSSIDEYLNQLSDDRREVINKLREVIKDRLPDEYEEKIQYDMISYVVPREKFPQGYHCNPEDDLCFISLGSQKNHIAIYHMGLYFFENVHKWFLNEYHNYMKTKPDVGKSCIRFKNMKTVPYELIGKLCEKISMKEFIDKYEENLSNNKK